MIILPNALGSKEAKFPRFCRKNFEYPFAPFRYFFYPFLICGVLKKAIFPPLRSKMTITPNFLQKIIQDFLYRVYIADADFWQKFLTKILNPQMGILTQSQIIFWENLNFQNRLNQRILTPGEKKYFFWRTQLPYLLPLTYHKFMTTFYFFFWAVTKKLFFSKNPIFHDQNFFSEKKCFFWKKILVVKNRVFGKNNFFVTAQKKKNKKSS